MRIFKRSRSSPTLFEIARRDAWIRGSIRTHVNEFRFLATLYPELNDVKLCTDREGGVLWHGKVGEIGEVITTYHLNGGRLTHSFQFLDQEESVSRMMNEMVNKLPHYTPPMALVHCLRWLRRKGGPRSGPMVSNAGRQEEVRSREPADA